MVFSSDSFDRSGCFYSRAGSALYKDDIREFLMFLYRTMHWYYVFLSREPLRHFCITVEDAFYGFSERLSICDFLARYSRYHARLAVCSIQYRTYCFRKDWDTQAPGWRDYLPTYDGVDLEACWEHEDQRRLRDRFKNVLAHSLRGAMRNNRPFELTPETIETYGFTAEDIATLEPIIAACNAELRAELRADYERLAAIDCIREER